LLLLFLAYQIIHLHKLYYTLKFIAFDTSQEIKDALEAHTIDLATFGMSSLDDYYQILDRFNALPTFYITREG